MNLARAELYRIRHWLAAVISIALLARLALWFGYQPVAYSDTPSYQRSALAILAGWGPYDGTRTPGYPAFLALLWQIDPRNHTAAIPSEPAEMTNFDVSAWQQTTFLLQLILGFAITLLIFFIGWQASGGKAWVGGVAALAHTLNPGQLFFEANLLTETLTTFWLMVAFAASVYWLSHLPSDPLSSSRATRSLFTLVIGLSAALAAITRPLFIYLPFWLFFFLFAAELFVPGLSRTADQTSTSHGGGLYRLPLPTSHCLLPTAYFLFPTLFILGGWMAFIHQRYGDWALTTMTGYHTIQHTGAYFEYVPDEYAALRDTYIRYRDEQIARTGTQTNAVWEAIPAMQRAAKLNFYDLSRLLTKLSVQLIREHPDLFLQNALSGWWMFWRAPVYWQADALRWPALAEGLKLAILAARAVFFAANLLFLAASLLFPLALIRNAVMGSIAALGSTAPHSPLSTRPFPIAPRLTLPATAWLIASAIWICSILQTLLDHGDNPRFLIPLQSLVILFLLLCFQAIRER